MMMRSIRILTLALFTILVSQVCVEGTEIKVCCVGEESYYYCQQMIEAFFGAEPVEDDDGRRKLMDGHLTWSCVMPGGEGATSDDDGRRRNLLSQGSVLEMIENGDCNFAMDMDAHDVYDANKEFGWEAIAGEDYGAGEGLTYYGVAVVPTEVCEANPNVSLADFRGMRSCHTGYKRTSGWTIPLATIIAMDQEEMGMDALQSMTDYEVMLDFFPEQCTAGPPADAPQEVQDAMCKNCIGDCQRGDGEPYMGYVGSLRCLMEGAGDIGFMKQSTPLDYAADGNTPEDWATMNMADLKLVCPDGGCAAPEDYNTCNYARIPSHMVAAAGDLPIDEIKSIFMEAASSEDWQLWMANAKNSALVNSRAEGYVPIEEDTITYMGQLTNVYSILEELGFY